MKRPSHLAKPIVLTGSHYVRVHRPAFAEAARLFPKARDFFELQRHALKLRFWPATNPVDERGQLLDMDWEWIKAMKGLNVGELRIDDHIGGLDNLRIVFFVGDSRVRNPLPMIWILSVLQKKRQDFTTNNITTFKARRKLVIARHYQYPELLR